MNESITERKNGKIKPELIISIIALLVAIASTIASVYFSKLNITPPKIPVSC